MRRRAPRTGRNLLAVAVITTASVFAGASTGSAALVRSVPSGVATTDAGTDAISEAAAELRRSAVYVDPVAERALSSEEVGSLRSAVDRAGTPVYVAVLRAAALDAAGGDANELTRRVAAATGLVGTYAVLAGDSFRAVSSELPSGDAGRLATAAFRAHSAEGPAAVLLDFVTRTGSAVRGSSGGASGGSSGAAGSSEDTSSDGISAGTVLLIVGAVVFGLWLWRRRRRARTEAMEQAQAEQADRQVLQAELSVLADDVLRLEQDVLLHPAAQSDYDSGVNRYRAATAALEYADEPIDLIRVRRVLEEARYSMDRARAIIAGRPVPDPPTDLRSPGRHGEPAIDLDEERRPVYVGYGGPFQSGWFGAGGGLFSGLLLGSMFGGFGGWGGGWGGTTVINEGDTYYGDGGGGGDLGGGDFGGGDWGGGGDFGGDFGGGGDF